LAWEQLRLAIVFDRSGSMEGDRLREARSAMRAVLEELKGSPTVSLWTFGHLRGVEKAQQLSPPVRWTRNEAARFDQKVNAVQSDGYAGSPIVHAMMEASINDLDLNQEMKDPKSELGTRILLVLTDGADNVFANQDKYNPGKRKTIKDF